MNALELKKLIREEVRRALKEMYRDPKSNLDVLIKLLERKKIAEALELLQAVKDGLESNNLEQAFDEAVENVLDSGMGRAFGRMSPTNR